MLRKYGGQQVPKGAYWDPRNWKIIMINTPGEELPGEGHLVYFRLNVFEMLALILTLSGMFVLFLPLVGIAICSAALAVGVVSFLGQKVLCVIIRKICQLETRMCEITKRYFCKSCGVECDDNITMIVKALIYMVIFLLGGVVFRYFGG